MNRQTAAAVALISAALLCGTLSGAAGETAQATEAIDIRAHVQNLHVYGSRGAPPVIVSSGDGGWIHLGPHVAEAARREGILRRRLRRQGVSRELHLREATLRPEDEPGDYKVLADYAARGRRGGRF